MSQVRRTLPGPPLKTRARDQLAPPEPDRPLDPEDPLLEPEDPLESDEPLVEAPPGEEVEPDEHAALRSLPLPLPLLLVLDPPVREDALEPEESRQPLRLDEELVDAPPERLLWAPVDPEAPPERVDEPLAPVFRPELSWGALWAKAGPAVNRAVAASVTMMGFTGCLLDCTGSIKPARESFRSVVENKRRA